MAYNIFDWAKEVTERKGNWNDFSEEDKQYFNPYMLNKVLSMNQNYIELVAYVQRYWLLSHEMLYSVYKQLLPKEKVWSKYIKANNKEKINEELLKAISQYYQISTRESKLYLKFLSQEEQIQILQSLGTPEEEINKIYGMRSKSGVLVSERIEGNTINKKFNTTKSKENNEPKKRGRPSKKV